MHSIPKENKLDYVTHSTNQASLSNLSDKYNYKPKLLNLLSLNTQSLTAKKVSFGNLISERNPDIIALSETWLKPDCPASSSQQDIKSLGRIDMMVKGVFSWHVMTHLTVSN